MLSLTSPAFASSSPLSPTKFLLHRRLRPGFSFHDLIGSRSDLNQWSKKKCGVCRAELAHDAPFAVAIGASILTSFVFPVPDALDEAGDDGGSAIDSTDARFAVMGIMSFIPYFNWLSWVFAWLDTGRQRYLVYSIVYLAPYIRTNLNLSPEESWLPIASIVLCIIHIQLEASIRNGDITPLGLFGQSETHFDDHQGTSQKRRGRIDGKFPSAREELEKRIRGFGIPRKPDQSVHLNDGDHTDKNEEK